MESRNKQTAYKQAYNEKSYDRLAITIPKGQKKAVEAAATAAGESVNAYTNGALLARMGLTEWPEAKQPPEDE